MRLLPGMFQVLTAQTAYKPLFHRETLLIGLFQLGFECLRLFLGHPEVPRLVVRFERDLGALSGSCEGFLAEVQIVYVTVFEAVGVTGTGPLFMH